MRAFLLLGSCLLFPVHAVSAASAVDFLIWLHNRHSINAVVFDGNTCLRTSGVWNPVANSRWLFLTWAEAPQAANQTDTIIFYAEESSAPAADSIEVFEAENYFTGSADLQVEIEVSGALYEYRTATSPIPKNGLWHTVFVSLDTVAKVGDVMVVEAPTGNYEFEHMATVPLAPVTINWPDMTVYDVGCYYGGDIQAWAKMPMAEFYADLGRYHWLLPQAVSDFVSQQGYSLGLSTSAASHDCAEPTAATAIPQVCHTGNANFFPNGPEGGAGLFSYQLGVVSGVLTTAPSDPCLRRGIGDGCLVP